MAEITPEEALAEARRRVAEAKETGAEVLDLGDLPLMELPEFGDMPALHVLALGNQQPPEMADGTEWKHKHDRPGFRGSDVWPLGTLVNLTSLSLGGCVSVSDVLPLGKLTNLTSLDLYRCSSVSDVSPLGTLTNLISLDLSGCRSVSDVSPLGTLTKLRELNLNYCSSVSDVSPLRTLTNLTSLELALLLALSNLLPLGKLTNLRRLNLSGSDSLSEISPLRVLTNLTSLNLSRVKSLSNVSALRALTNLTSLNLRGCKSLSEVSPLTRLGKMRELKLSECSLSDVSPLGKLTNLTSLDLSWCSSVSDVSPLGKLTNLISLDLSGCRSVSDVSPLGTLTKLRELNLNYCSSVSDVSPLRTLTSLQRLNLSSCSGLKCFEPLRRLVYHLTELRLGWCNFVDLPKPIFGNNSDVNIIAAVHSHFADLDRVGADDTLELKAFVLGNGGVGKTQLSRRLRGEPFDQSVPTTHGVQLGHLDLTLDGRKVRLNFWDFGGQDIYHGTHSLFVCGPGIFLLLWHPDRETGTDTEAGITIRRRPLSYWLDYVRGLAGSDMPTLVVQSQCETLDERRPLPVPLPSDFRYTRELQFAAKNDWGLEELTGCIRQAVRDLLDRHPVPPIGKNRARVRDALRAVLEKPVAERRRTLTQDEFKAVCDDAGGVASEKELLKYLHNCGVVFHKPELFENRVIVDQSWALDAIYSLFHRRDDLQSLLRYGNGRFTRTDIARVWEARPQPFTKADQELFLGMMESCGVCFRVREIGSPSDRQIEYRAPEWFPEWDEVRGRVTGPLPTTPPSAQSDVHYAFLHEGILRTFLSRIGQRTGDNAIFWKYGCWFFDQRSRSQVMIESRQGEKAGHPGAGEISFRAWGEEPDALVGALLAELQGIPVGVPPEIVRRQIPRRSRAQRDDDSAEALSTATPQAEPLADVRPGPLPPEMNTSREVFISYAWGEDVTPEGREREAVVDRMCACLAGQGWTVVRDKQRMRNGDSIREFMLRIGRGQRVIVVLSEKYLRSPFCVNELHLIYQRACSEEKEFQSRIIPVALSDAKYHDWRARATWAKHWKQEHAEMEENLKDLGVNDHRAYELCRVWQAVIATMLGYVADMLHPVGFDAIVADDFRAVREMLDRVG